MFFSSQYTAVTFYKHDYIVFQKNIIILSINNISSDPEIISVPSLRERM